MLKEGFSEAGWKIKIEFPERSQGYMRILHIERKKERTISAQTAKCHLRDKGKYYCDSIHV